VNVQDDVDADVNAVTECLERTFEPSNFAFWKWGATWMRTKYNSCEKNYALGYTPDNELGMALCCPNASESEEPAVEDAAARMLAEDDAEAEAEEDDEAEAEAVSGPTKYYNNMLRDKMCVGGPVTSAPGAPTDTTVDGPAKPNKENKEEENKENKDKKDKKDKETMVEGSASTFGFTALALMLVTA